MLKKLTPDQAQNVKPVRWEGQEPARASIPRLRTTSPRPAPVSAQHRPLRTDPAQQADLVNQPQPAQTPKPRSKAGSTFLKSLLLPFKIGFFIIHVFVLTVGLMTIIGASGLWWVANHQKEANEMAAATLDYMDKNKERLKPATDFMGLVFDALLPSKVRPSPVEPEGEGDN
jgi:hypothetical protein